ncbi:MAG: DNA-(Apurinic or apyrimidinic site) lyase [Microgenomates group bacterium GW2011_GWC1_37_8]|uniref:DNA-(Apurinic or apyrimidinic site) lyase n=1 Tax=Candidatus Woesebacteria bacterium GW2011_GWB1_38_8 TaxID=1618570 RepID=A0A0G0L0G4_9BACT|nr:MAG: DNA-(Apurinic or apyrimidinic site) lyase [Microgenomates group bacterium GW2011_GWC1_37_8]KKQ85433.1 MAG: DNA-(Apurinic or apyrimidinic site) lyase [Candidatus Woesebacteria bacterium GW2011_GWB1_38_8]
MKYDFDPKDRYSEVFFIFRKNYCLVPLEVFGKNPYKTLISTLLSSRTKDETTLLASKRLFNKAPNIKKLNLLEVSEIRNLIYPVSFYKTKAKHLKKLAEIITKDYKSKIPRARNDLIHLTGVGRKTANLVLNRAFNIPAIAVDTHVHKISNLLGWVKTKTPEQTEKELVKVVPKKYWSDMNRLFVSIGRQFNTKKKLEKFLKKEKLIKIKMP